MYTNSGSLKQILVSNRRKKKPPCCILLQGFYVALNGVDMLICDSSLTSMVWREGIIAYERTSHSSNVNT
jgi:hypothetical protein